MDHHSAMTIAVPFSDALSPVSLEVNTDVKDILDASLSQKLSADSVTLHYLNGFRDPSERNLSCAASVLLKNQKIQVGMPTLEDQNIFNTYPWDQTNMFKLTRPLPKRCDWLFFHKSPLVWRRISKNVFWKGNAKRSFSMVGGEVITTQSINLRFEGVDSETLKSKEKLKVTDKKKEDGDGNEKPNQDNAGNTKQKQGKPKKRKSIDDESSPASAIPEMPSLALGLVLKHQKGISNENKALVSGSTFDSHHEFDAEYGESPTLDFSLLQCSNSSAKILTGLYDPS
ncbi:unnamed protein product [Arabidopsis lyrata]|nr:unnamed protein product [Arabidopsis lyrata]